MPVEFISSINFGPSTAEDGPISHAGEFYTFEDFQTDIKPVQEALAISVGGSSQQAYDVGGRQGDIFGWWGEPLKETAEQIASVNAAADAAPLVRQELARREANGTAPILDPDSAPELARHAGG